LASVIEIDDLGGFRKMQIRLIPDPLGAVSQHHFFLRSRPTSLPGFGIQPAAEFLTALDRSYIAGRGFVPYGIAFFIDGGLCEYAAQLGLARVRRLTVLFAGPACTLLTHDGNAGAIHLRVQNGNAWSHRDRQLQLQGSLELVLLANFDIFSDGFGCALYRLGCERQAGQELTLLLPR